MTLSFRRNKSIVHINYSIAVLVVAFTMKARDSFVEIRKPLLSCTTAAIHVVHKNGCPYIL